MYKAGDNSLEDDNELEFHGATLQIGSESFNANSKKSTAKLQHQSSSDSQRIDNFRDSLNTSSNMVPAVSSGTDVLSPIGSVPVSPVRVAEAISNPNNANQTVGLVSFHNIFRESPKRYFSHRRGLLENAIQETIRIVLLPAGDVNVISSWLLTEISLWDHERERLVILTDKTVTTVKYDFIALRLLDHRSVRIDKIDTVAFGRLVYPPASIVPRLGGLAEGVSGLLDGLNRFSSAQRAKSKPPPVQCSTIIDWESFAPRDRNSNGVRLMWNGGQPLPFTTMWNPFSNDIPWNTYTSHPLFWSNIDDETEVNKEMYNIENFFNTIINTLQTSGGTNIPRSSEVNANDNSNATKPFQPAVTETTNASQPNTGYCQVLLQPIVLQSYVGLGALLHNKNSLGFFKVRGKFSF